MAKIFWAAFLILAGVLPALGQGKTKKKFFSHNGQVALSYETYAADPVNYPNFRPRYESGIWALNANYNIRIGKYFSLPFGIHISNRKKSYSLPEVPNENLFTYVQNPRNNIHIDPAYRWAKFHLGTHTPQYSPLTSGDRQIFGAGFEINPGKFILSANYGKSQIAIEPDSLLNIRGAYRRHLMGGRIGFGKANGSRFTINLVKVKDDPASVINRPIGLDPVEGITVSPYAEFKLGKKIKVHTETAGSIFTKNTISDTTIFDVPLIEEISKFITINALSAADFAHQTGIEYSSKNFSLGGEVKYVGPQFSPAGFFAMENDYLDYKLSTSLKLKQGKFNFSGTIGLRTDNVQKTLIQTTRRIIGATSVNIKFSKAFAVKASYSNFGMNNQGNPYQRIEYVNNSLTINPVLKIKRPKAKHTISARYRTGVFKQYDIQVQDFVARNTQSISASYRTSLKSIPLRAGIHGLYIDNQSPTSAFKMINFGVNLSYQLFKKKLRPSISITHSQMQRNGFTPSQRLIARIKTKYKFNKKMNLAVSYSFNQNKYGSFRPGASLIEHKFQTTITQKF